MQWNKYILFIGDEEPVSIKKENNLPFEIPEETLLLLWVWK